MHISSDGLIGIAVITACVLFVLTAVFPKNKVIGFIDRHFGAVIVLLLLSVMVIDVVFNL